MTIAKYLWILGVCTALCWVAWFLVLLMLNPVGVGLLALVLFYISLFCALIGTFSIVGYIFRVKIMRKDEMAHKGVNIASRQSVLFSFLLIAALMLQSQRFLTWWTLLILIAVLSFVELFFISYKQNIN